MKKPPQKRLPHGVTQALVFDASMRLSIGKTAARAVGRAEIQRALPLLSATTIDDRLRVLKVQGRIVRTPHGYKPFLPEPQASKWNVPINPPGTRAVFFDGFGNEVRMEWV